MRCHCGKAANHLGACAENDRIENAREIRAAGLAIEQTRKGLLCHVDNLPTTALAHFTMALASLDTARAQLTLAFLHASKGD